MFDLVII